MIKESWLVGKISITRLVEQERCTRNGGPGTLLPDAYPSEVLGVPWLRPHFVSERGELYTSTHALLVETPDLRLIVDTCAGNHKERHLPIFNHLATGFLQNLEQFGWSRDSVDAVLCTHLHLDHIGWNTMLEDGKWVPTFPKANYFFAQEEFDYWHNELKGTKTKDSLDQATYEMIDGRQSFADSLKPILDAGLAKFIATDAQILPGISLFPTPGHTLGHVSVLIEDDGNHAVITGDVMNHPCQIARPEWSTSFDSDPRTSETTRHKFFQRFADTSTLIIGTHFASPTAGWVVRDGGGFRFRPLAGPDGEAS